MKKDINQQIAVIVFVLATIAINGLANALPLNGLTTGEISDRFEVFFVPAGYVFSIWGVIYLGLLAYAVYQALPNQKENPRLQRTRGLFILASIANVAWLFFWHYEIFTLTIFAMLTLLVCLILIYLRLEVARSEVPLGEKWFVRVPFSIYLGWITVATIANMTSLLDYLNWGGWGISDQVWAVIMLFVGTTVASILHFTRNDIAYILVLLWAFIGIAVKHEGTALVATTAWITTAILAIVLVLGILLAQRKKEAKRSQV
jgi:benzodiazapine receptor